jgi:transcriptional regulator with XRE-family HTH domain
MADQAELKRIRKLLELLVVAKNARISEMEQRLGVASGYIARIFTGKVMLKYEHILDILELLDVPRAFFFRTAYSSDHPPGVEDLVEQIRSLSLGDPVPPQGLTREEVESMIERALAARERKSNSPEKGTVGSRQARKKE